MSIRSYPTSSLVAYTTKGGPSNSFSVPASKSVYLFNVRAFNNSGGTINVGICQSYSNTEWKVFQYTNTGPVYTDVTSAVQAGTATALFSGTNNDGYVVQTNRSSLGLIGVTVSTAQSGGTFEYKYWNGTTWATLNTIEVPAALSSTTNYWVVFLPPSDWAVGGAASLNSSMYSIRVRSTTAPAGAVSITSMWVGSFIEFYQQVANNVGIQLTFPDTKPYVLQGGEGLFPYFGTASNSNQFGAFYAITG